MRPAIVFYMCSAFVLAASPGCEGSTAADPAASPAQEGGLRDRDPELARKLVAEGAVLLDVRTPEEYGARHIEGAVNLPVGDLDRRMFEIDALTDGDRSTPIVVYCSSGRRSGVAKEKLLAAGYDQVTNLGGIDDWYR
jgi:rhodanese-related sulfurtransferase